MSQVFGKQAEAHTADLGARAWMAASVLPQGKRCRGPDRWLQCGHHASATGFVWMNVRRGGSYRRNHMYTSKTRQT